MAQTEQAVKKVEAPASDNRSLCMAGVSIAGFIALTVLSKPAAPMEFLPWTINPTGHIGSFGMYFIWYVISMLSKEILSLLLTFFAAKVFLCKRTDGEDAKVKKLMVFGNLDMFYLSLSTVIEFLSMSHLAAFLLNGPVETGLSSFTVLNGPVAFIFLLTINDIMYYFWHVAAHNRIVYPYCHKQHHRQYIPFRGYRDASNLHPIEELSGPAIFLASLFLTSRVFGLHSATAYCCTVSWGSFNIANHMAFDAPWHLPVPFPAFIREHQMHHRNLNCNYCMLTTMCDRLFGSYRSFTPLNQPVTEPTKTKWYEGKKPRPSKERQRSRCSALPSPWAVVVLGVGLFAAAVLEEVWHSGKLPHPVQLSTLFRSLVFIINGTLICTAVQNVWAMPSDAELRMAETNKGRTEAPKEAFEPGHLRSFEGDKGVFKTSAKPGAASEID